MSSFLGSFSQGLYRILKNVIGETFAITTTNFVELNVKRGNQFGTISKSGPLTLTSSEYWLFKTGPDPIILKRRILKTNSNEVNWYVYNNPVITTNGTAQSIGNYNEVTPKTPAVQFYKSPTFSSKGNSYIIDYVPGGVNVGGRSNGGLAEEGFERILAPNKNYLIEIQNSGDNPVTYQLRLDWYEGPIVPLGEGEIVES